MTNPDSSSNLLSFEGKNIRKTWHEGEWWFSILDILQVLTDTTNPKRYWNGLKKRDSQLDSEGGTKISYPLSMQTLGGKQRVLCANTEGVLRLVMSVTSPKVEPLKQWLAQAGREKIEETADPELTIERIYDIYRAKGYSDEWIERRKQTIEARKRLTDEWKKRDVKEGQESAILTAEIAKVTFGVAPSEHAAYKNLDKENLRDHMTPLELIFTALGEEATRIIAIKDDVQGFTENQDVAQRGGSLAGDARRNFEQKEGIKVLSSENFLKQLPSE